MKRYSRLESVEEKRNVKKAVTFVFLTIAFLVALFFIGIPVLGKFVAFVSGIGKSASPISVSDSTPPAPPRFETYPDFTNQKTIDLKGFSEPGATIELTVNGNLEEVIADADGHFIFSDIRLNSGDNRFSATVIDTAGNQSQTPKEFKIIFDDKPPELNIDSPSDGSSFFGTKQKQVSIQGTTESGCEVNINDRIVSVDDSGKFQYATTLNDGENKFTVRSFDPAGNTTEKILTLSFTP